MYVFKQAPTPSSKVRRSVSWMQAVWVGIPDALPPPLLTRHPRDFRGHAGVPCPVTPRGHPTWGWGDGVSLRGLGQSPEWPCGTGTAILPPSLPPSASPACARRRKRLFPGDLEASGAAASGDHSDRPGTMRTLKSLAPRSITAYAVPGVRSPAPFFRPASPSQSRGAAAEPSSVWTPPRSLAQGLPAGFAGYPVWLLV